MSSIPPPPGGEQYGDQYGSQPGPGQQPAYPPAPGSQPGYAAAPGYQDPPQVGAPAPTSAPASIVRAKYAMWAGAVLQVLSILAGFFLIDDMRTAVEDAMSEAGTAIDPAAVDLAVTAGLVMSVVIGLIGTALWLVTAWLAGRGKGWARIMATVLFVLYVLSFLVNLTQPQPMLSTIVAVVMLIVGAVALFFLWQKPSTAWFQAHKAR